jgi:hypothetical protein
MYKIKLERVRMSDGFYVTDVVLQDEGTDWLVFHPVGDETKARDFARELARLIGTKTVDGARFTE